MRYCFILLTICFLLPGCKTRDKITYDIPANYPEARREQLIDICNKGKALYKEHCSDCHGIFTKGKDNVPNFTSIQIDNYSARFMRRDPRNHAVVQQMSPEQLNDVITFLRFKKSSKDTSTVKKPPMRRRM